MLRFSAKLPLVASSLLRFQSSTTAAASGANQPARQSRGRFYRTPTQYLPRFEIHDVRDDPAQGSMTRVAVDGKQLLVSQFPQLGPRKADPNDPSPQFDRDRRISLRLRHKDLAALVGVVEDRMPSHHMENNAYNLTFEKTAAGFVLKGDVRRASSAEKEPWTIVFEQQFAVTLEHFLQAALTESFGFQQFYGRAGERNQNGNGGNANAPRQQQQQNQQQQQGRYARRNDGRYNRNNNDNGNYNAGRNRGGSNESEGDGFQQDW